MITAKKFPKLILVTLMFALFSPFIATTISAARFEIDPSSGTFPAECTRTLLVYADASGESSNAADLIIFYNPAEIAISDANPDLPGVQVGTGTAYAAYASNEVDAGIGRIRMTTFSIGTNLTTRDVIARIDFTSKPGVTSTTFTIDYDGVGATKDSNIASSSTSLDLLTSVINSTYSFASGVCDVDTTPPSIQFVSPTLAATGVALDSNVTLRLTDNLSGIDISTIQIIINGVVYTADSPELTITGDPLDYNIIIDPSVDFPAGSASTIYVTATDFNGNVASATNVFNIPSTPGQTDTPTDQVCDYPIGGGSSFQVATGSPILDELLNSIIDDLGISGTGAVITGLALLLSMLSALLPLLSLLNAPGALLSLFSFFIGKRQTKPWGLIIDDATGKPIPFATCRIYTAETTNVVTQTVSDTEGRYGFVLSVGNYRLEIKHNDYLDHNESLKITEEGGTHLRDVRMKPKTNQRLVQDSIWKERLIDAKDWLINFLNSLRPALFILGLVLSLISVLENPGLFNYLIFVLYFVTMALFIINKLSKAPKFASVVDSVTNLRIPHAIIKFYDPESWQLVDTQVANANGQFDFFGESGTYGLLVAVRGYKFPSEKQTDLEVVENKYSGMLKADLRKGKNKIRIFVDPSNEVAAPAPASATPTSLTPELNQPEAGNLATPFS